MKMNAIIGTLLLCWVSGCGFQQNRPGETVEMIGISEMELNSSKTVVSISFNGSSAQKSDFMKQVKEGELSKFQPKLQHENLYQEGEGFGAEEGRFIHNMTYHLLAENPGEVDEIAKIMEKHKISGYLNTNGSFVGLEELEKYQEELFKKALENAVDRISGFADYKGKSYEILEIAESDDPGYSFFPMDGIVYNNKLNKKIKVKAALR